MFLTKPMDKVMILPIDMADSGEVAGDRCPTCRARVVVRSESEVVIRNAILRVDAPTGRVSAKCSRCKSWLEVPLRYVG